MDETGAEDYASLQGGVENWEAAVKTSDTKNRRTSSRIYNQPKRKTRAV